MTILRGALALLLYPALFGQPAKEFEELGRRAIAAVRAGQLEDAVAAYRRMLVLDPVNGGVRFDLALALNRLGRATESLSVLGTPRESDALALAGANYRILGQPKQAAQRLRQAFQVAPSPPVAYDLGLTLLDLDQAAEAERVFRRFPEDSRCLVGLGLAAFATGRHREAEEALEKAAAREPSAADIPASLGDVYAAANRYDKAEAAYAQAMQREPGSADHLVKAARNLTRLDREAEAVALYRQALRLDPLQPEANAQLARIQATGQPAEARRLLETAIVAEPGKANGYYQLLLQCNAQQDRRCASMAKQRFEQLRSSSSAVQVDLSAPPSVVVEGPRGERRWGRYQFPTLQRLADGRLMVTVHTEADSATAYGTPKKVFVSGDNGHSWQEDSAAANQPYGLRLRNGEWLRIETPTAQPASSLTLPEPAGQFKSYQSEFKLYRLRDLPRDLKLIFFQRFAGGQWREETAELNDPEGLRYQVEGRFPRIWWGDLRAARDGSLLAVTYPSFLAAPPYHFMATAWRSADLGHTWQLRGRIPYQPDPTADPQSSSRDGFTEPAFEILPDGSLYAVLRTTDGHGLGPMYESRSRDQGRTWTKPTVLAPYGVLPRLLKLENGILVLASGRPGVQLRFSLKGDATDWTTPWDLLPADADKPQADSCGYPDLVALDRDSFLLVYSWFQKPDADGQPRKAILARRIRVTPTVSAVKLNK